MHYYLDDGGYYLGSITPFMAILPIYYRGTHYVLVTPQYPDVPAFTQSN
jgi:hypothetical protein